MEKEKLLFPESCISKKAILLIWACLFYSIVYGQDKKYVKQVDSTVVEINKKYKTCDSTIFNSDDFLAQTTDGGGKLTIYNCENNFIKIVEWIGVSYGFRVRTFYSENSKLIYVSEVHNEFLWDKKKNKYNRNDTRRIYSTFYYVENDFHHFSSKIQESECHYIIEDPEPITYVWDLIKINREYLTKKTEKH